MKKYAFILVFALSFTTITGCGDSSSSSNQDNVTVTDNRTKDDAKDNKSSDVIDNRKKDTSSGETTNGQNEDATPVTVSESDFEVEGHLFTTKFGSSAYSRYYLIIKSNAQVPVKISGNATAKDTGGNAIGAGSTSIDVLGPGETSIAYFFFDDVDGIAEVDYQLSYDTNTHYYPVISNLDMQQTLNDKNVTISLTNNGDASAQFVEAYALFFDANHNIIHTDSNYVTDSDSEIKPGATLSAQLDIYDGNYDHVEVYLTGRASDRATISSQPAASVSDADFGIEEYLYEGAFGTTQYFLVIKNNSSETVEIGGNGTAYDEGGNSIGAANFSIDVLGPGETSIGYFYFNDVSGIAKVDYQLTYSQESMYSPVIKNLNIQQTLNDKNVIVSVTNNGDYAAQFVEAHALFFDAENNVIATDSTYVTDDDSEIKPGATISKQLDARSGYDHAEVYFTGRAH